MSKNFVLEIESIITRLQPIRLEMLQAENHFREELDRVNLGNLESARSLTHYVSLRRHDIRELQQDLGRLALSSLGRLESHAIATLDALLAMLYKLAGKEWHGRAIEAALLGMVTIMRTLRSAGASPRDSTVCFPSRAEPESNSAKVFQVPVSSAGNRHETTSGKSQPLPLSLSAPRTTLLMARQ